MHHSVKIAGTVAVAFIGGAALLSPSAAQAQTHGMPPRCYQWPAERIALDRPTTAGFHTNDIMVTEGSPCRDVNVKSVKDVDRRNTCRTLRVRYTANGAVSPWRKVCSRWVVLAYSAPEGDVYVVESKGGRPANVAVRG